MIFFFVDIEIIKRNSIFFIVGIFDIKFRDFSNFVFHTIASILSLATLLELRREIGFIISLIKMVTVSKLYQLSGIIDDPKNAAKVII